jgi:hypothetical protein
LAAWLLLGLVNVLVALHGSHGLSMQIPAAQTTKFVVDTQSCIL